MLVKTHTAITLFFVLLFLPFVSHKVIFVVIALVATLIPDIDSPDSKLGKKKIFRPLQFFSKHRGLFHSFTFLILATILLVLFVPVLALGFFLGYSSHLMADSFTLQGIYPFYPLKRRSFGRLRTGSSREKIILIVFIIFDILLIFKYIFVS